MEEKNKGLTIGEIFHAMFHKKWLLLAVTVIVMLFGVIFVELIYNPSKTIYQCEYNFKFPGASEKKYPDGKDVVYNDFVSLESLQQVKDSDEKYADIDINRLHKNNAISIEITYSKPPSGTTYVEVIPVGYLVKVKQKYFKSDEIARDFIMDLVRIPVDYALNANRAIDYKENITRATAASDYNTTIDYLIDQKNLILDNYEKLITLYSNGFVYNKKSIAQAQTEVINFFSENDLDALKTEVIHKGLWKSKNYIYNIEQKKNALTREYDENYLKIKNLQKASAEFIKSIKDSNTIQADESLAVYQNQIAQLVTRNSTILSTINNEYQPLLEKTPYTAQSDGTVLWDSAKDIDTKISEEERKAFEDKIEKITDNLMTFTDDFVNFVHAINDEFSFVYYYNSARVIKTGGINLLLAVLVFLVLGFVLGCGINFVIDYPRKNKSNENEELDSNEESIEENKSTELNE